MNCKLSKLPWVVVSRRHGAEKTAFSCPTAQSSLKLAASVGRCAPAAWSPSRRSVTASSPDFMEGKSAEQMLEVVIPRVFKPTSEECPFCRDAPVKENGSKCLGICRNPQNTPGPLVFPHPMQEVEDAVRLQLNAMQTIDEPRRYHGLQVLYEYAVEAGEMDRSRYFGFSTDMYHFDHFMSKALSNYDALVNCQSHEVVSCEDFPKDRKMVKVRVKDKQGKDHYFVFIMLVRKVTRFAGCWMTHRLIPTDENYASKWISRA
mmetsp:Transcript_11649/g.42582  ORF Transcript_11649/g.42582 Transcript_11649/m.42582 type:complete len:261 (-) Transcript_11649:4725-5507(-)